MIDLSGQIAVVTGGSRGIGAAVCRYLARAGADIVLAYRRDHDSASHVVHEIEEMGRKAMAVPGDLGQDQANAALFAQAVDRFGAVDIVVGNAGIWKRSPIDEMTEENWNETLSANLSSIAHLCRHASRHMKPRGKGNLILISSTAGQRGEAHFAHYAASKGAIIALTRSLAAELGPNGIRVNCVAPGWVTTGMTDDVFADEAFETGVIQQIPLRRIATADDIAGPVLFLASELSRHVQGAVINVNGGSVLC